MTQTNRSHKSTGPYPATNGTQYSARPAPPGNHISGGMFSDVIETSVLEDIPESQGDGHDADSAMGSDGQASSAQSMTSSIMHYRVIHGRSYHREVGTALYWAPIDGTHRASLDMIHHVLTLGCHGRLHNAPIDRAALRKVLDIGAGTGAWAMDFADENPHVEVVGTDLSPMQPFWVPPNLRFEMEDCTQDWTFAPDLFDYVHMRWLVGSIRDWPALFEQAFRACKSGGWVESFEPSLMLASENDSISEQSAMGRWGRLFTEGGKRTGASFTVVEDGVQERAMRAAGFVDIGTFSFKCPLGNWPGDPRLKEMGQLAQLSLGSDVEGFILYIALILGWSEEEVGAYASQLKMEMLSRRHQSYHWHKIVWGRKP